MANRRPWYQRNGGEFVMGTLHMPIEARLAYSLIIDMLNDRDRPLPDDAGFICGFTGLSKRKWREVREFLLSDQDASGQSRIFIDPNGDLTNPRFDREHRARHGLSELAKEWGREGGLKSAALRAQADLFAEKEPKKSRKTAEKQPINAGKTEVFSEIIQGETPEINQLSQDPPQPTRARKIPDTILTIQTNEQSISKDGAEFSQLDHHDLKALLDACSLACGFYPVSPGQIAKAFDQIRGWRDAGVSFDEVVIPTIKAQIAGSNDPTSSFARFNRLIMHEHAKSKARPANGPEAYKSLESPVVDCPDELPQMAALRRDLLKRLGPARFCRYANTARFEPVEPTAGRNPLRIKSTKSQGLRLCESDRAAIVQAVAKQHGFSEVWQE